MYRRESDFYVFFFHLGRRAGVATTVDLDGRRLDLVVGCKTCGVVHLRGDSLVSVLFKGRNEVEDVCAEVEVRYGDQIVRHAGDLLRFF